MTLLSPNTLPDLFLKQAKENPDHIYCYHEENGKWVATSFKDQLDDVLRLSRFFQDLKIKRGDSIAIMLPTSREWDVIEKGLSFIGAAVVGLDPHAPLEQKKHILSLAECASLILTEKDPGLNIPQINLAEIEAALKKEVGIAPSVSCSKSDIYTLVFTSGTTSQPKAIAYTHEQFLIAASSILEVFKGVGKEDRMLAWLPLSNLFQRMLDVLALYQLTPIYFTGNPKEVMNKIRAVNPTFFIGVPLFYERIRQEIFKRVNQKSPLLKKVFEKALYVTEKEDKNCLESIFNFIAVHLIFRPIRNVMGTSMRFMISGSAPCPKSVLNFFWALGIPLYEAYGLSENIVPMAIGSPDQYKRGSVGKILKVNTIRFFEDQEIGVKGPGVFKGYLKGEKTSPFREGYYLTGDTGYLDEDGYLFLTGRKTDWVKSSSGNRISIIEIENALKELAYIHQIAVIGSRKAPLAIIFLGYPVPDNEIASDFKEKLKGFKRYEQIGGVLILDRPFSIEEGELTPNLKLKRTEIENRFNPILNEIESNVHEGQFFIWRK